ncbi:MAG: hypothetical protein E7666_02960 [Ruminococcaceae bacterium]|nr:hypothetical protein [Oscillospiraceae bacterium]
MKDYLITLIAVAMAITVFEILSPAGIRGALTRHMRWLTGLLLICVLIAPLRNVIDSLQDLVSGDISLPELEFPNEDGYRDQMESALGEASTEYFTQSLTRMLEERFAIETGEVRCHVEWQKDGELLAPSRITVILSGRAIWKDTGAIEAFVESLLGCECISAID